MANFLNNSADQARLQRYKEMLQDMERSLDVVDRHMYTNEYMIDLEQKLSDVITGIQAIQKRSRTSFADALGSLYNARKKLVNASALLTAKESNRRAFYRCLSEFQSSLFEAWQYF